MLVQELPDESLCIVLSKDLLDARVHHEVDPDAHHSHTTNLNFNYNLHESSRGN